MGVIVLVLTFYFFLDRIGSLHGGRSRLKILFEGFWRTRHILVFVDLHTTAKSVTLSHSNKSTVGSSHLHPTLGSEIQCSPRTITVRDTVSVACSDIQRHPNRARKFLALFMYIIGNSAIGQKVLIKIAMHIENSIHVAI